ncbi:MAG: ammonium transporter [Acidiferrobacterales bacterium]|nr:ammonium transporter [Acidiferrobacterales bacterium]
MKLLLIGVTAILSFGLLSPAAYAQAEEMTTDQKLDLLLIGFSAMLVFIMQGGFALLESGMVRAKNTVNVLMKNYIDVCVVMLVFWAVGYGLMWGSNPTGFFGTNKFLFASGEPIETMNLFYQVMFAATAATIISGALAERVNFVAYIIISVFVSGFIYPIFGSWAWGDGGWLNEVGFIDFAGGTVVHGVGGWSALAAAIILGPRLGRFSKDGEKRHILGHNLPLVALSGFLLWFGWFGFNGGSAGRVDASFPLILFNTNIGGAAGGLAGVLMMLFTRQPVLLTTTIAASIGGLVAITSGAATMTPIFAAITGAIGGMVAVFGITLLEKLGIDDAVGAIPCHAFAGFWGTLATGIFYSDNMFDLGLILIQLTGAVACMLWSFIGAFLLFSTLNAISRIRVNAGDERRGLDYSEHYEIGYPEFQTQMLNPGKTQTD